MKHEYGTRVDDFWLPARGGVYRQQCAGTRMAEHRLSEKTACECGMILDGLLPNYGYREFTFHHELIAVQDIATNDWWYVEKDVPFWNSSLKTVKRFIEYAPEARGEAVSEERLKEILTECAASLDASIKEHEAAQVA